MNSNILVFVVYSFYTNTKVECNISFVNVISEIMDTFYIYDPIVIDTNLSMSGKFRLYKKLLNSDHRVSYNLNDFQRFQSFIIFTELENYNIWDEIQTNGPMLVVTKIQKQSDLDRFNLSIGTEAYFLDRNSLKVYESYTINNIHFTKYLGQFQIKTPNSALFIEGNLLHYFVRLIIA